MRESRYNSGGYVDLMRNVPIRWCLHTEHRLTPTLPAFRHTHISCNLHETCGETLHMHERLRTRAGCIR